MKNRFQLWIMLLALVLGSCRHEEPDIRKPKGLLEINIGLFINVNEIDSHLKSTLAAEDFKVTIFTASGTEVQVFENASEMPPEIELEIGAYYVTAHSDNNLPAAFDNPYYFGQSDVFTITAGSTQSVTLGCELANTMVSVIYSENIKSNFSDYSTTVGSSAGSLTFGMTETRAGYFQPLPLNISAVLTYQKSDGSFESKTLTGNIPVPQPKKHYEIHVDATGAEGTLLFQINLDESIDPAEIVEITDNGTTETGDLANGELLITEVMYDPTSLSDTEGEWFEVFNNSGRAIDLNQLVIRRNNTESHVITGGMILEPGSYGILSRTAGAVAGNKYVYGTAITLTNTGAVLSICNFGTDGTDGSVICAVDYGQADFPGASGASVCLDPAKYNPTDIVLSSSWCVSKTPYSTGDMGTPGLVNDSCN